MRRTDKWGRHREFIPYEERNSSTALAMSILGALMIVAFIVALAACGTAAPEATDEPSTTVTIALGPMPTDTPSLVAVATEFAERVAPPTTDPCNHEGLNCLPFAPAGLSPCDEMNWWRVQWSIPDRWGDEPRDGPKIGWGRGWRESNCEPWANSHLSAGCCFGYWQIASSNITAPGYAAAGVFSNCGVFSKWDYWDAVDPSPLQRQRQACIVAGLIAYHTARGEDPGWLVWDRWL